MTETVFRLKRHLTSFQIMILGFAGVILLGALVLMLPIATVQRVWTPFHEALFTSTSAVCVTGLVVQDTGSYWSAFGQTVILLLIQIGGLGVITGAVTFLMLSGRNITLKERSAMQDAISAPAVGGIVRLTRFILKGTFLVELLGALALLPVLAGPCPAGADEVSMNKAGVRELMEIEDGIISRELAERIVKYREENGPFRTEKDLLRVPDLNPALLDILMLEEKDGDLVYEADAYVSMPTY
mgnify:CR=1 FL=1